jgi:methylmalonyl-CoA mutase N-terminal domain/subunit
VVVGVNAHQEQEASPEDVLTIDPDAERAQVERLRSLRARRDGSRTRAALADLRRCAVDGGNTLPTILTAARSRATLGEIADELRAVWGEHRDDGSGI